LTRFNEFTIAKKRPHLRRRRTGRKTRKGKEVQTDKETDRSGEAPGRKKGEKPWGGKRKGEKRKQGNKFTLLRSPADAWTW